MFQFELFDQLSLSAIYYFSDILFSFIRGYANSVHLSVISENTALVQ